jgi:hypothetical protein
MRQRQPAAASRRQLFVHTRQPQSRGYFHPKKAQKNNIMGNKIQKKKKKKGSTRHDIMMTSACSTRRVHTLSQESIPAFPVLTSIFATRVKPFCAAM